MCGYCVEGAILLDFMAGEQTTRETLLDAQWVSIYLQESQDPVGILTLFQESDHFPGSIAIAFCRRWESLLQHQDHGVNHPLTAETVIHQFLGKLREHSDHGPWHALGNEIIYRHRQAWDSFVGDSRTWVAHAEAMLVEYHRDHLEEATPEARDCDRTAFFPLVFFALCVLLNDHRPSDMIERIALGHLSHTPSFLGEDLWLQRKAFLACVQQAGVGFLLGHYDAIRLELIDYALLKHRFDPHELALLNAHVLSHPHWVMGIDADAILDRIAQQTPS